MLIRILLINIGRGQPQGSGWPVQDQVQGRQQGLHRHETAQGQ